MIYINRQNIHHMAPWIDPRGTLLIGNIGQIPYRIEHIRMRRRIRRHDHLVAVHVYARRARPRDIGRHGEEAEVATQKPRHDSINKRVVEQIEELIAFVGEVPVFVASHQHHCHSLEKRMKKKGN